MSADGTARVINYLFADLRPHLPSRFGIKVTPHAKWTTVQRSDDGSVEVHGMVTMVRKDDQGRPSGGHSSAVSVRKLAPSSPFIPRSARRQMAAKHALDILLGLAYPQPSSQANGFSFSKGPDFEIVTADRPVGVVVSYRAPGSDERIELKPLPPELFE